MARSEWTVTMDEAGARLDLFLSEKAGLTRSRVEKLIRDGQAQVDGAQAAKPASWSHSR